jgi:hypothetical protein
MRDVQERRRAQQGTDVFERVILTYLNQMIYGDKDTKKLRIAMPRWQNFGYLAGKTSI